MPFNKDKLCILWPFFELYQFLAKEPSTCFLHISEFKLIKQTPTGLPMALMFGLPSRRFLEWVCPTSATFGISSTSWSLHWALLASDLISTTALLSWLCWNKGFPPPAPTPSSYTLHTWRCITNVYLPYLSSSHWFRSVNWLLRFTNERLISTTKLNLYSKTTSNLQQTNIPTAVFLISIFSRCMFLYLPKKTLFRGWNMGIMLALESTTINSTSQQVGGAQRHGRELPAHGLTTNAL